MPDSLFALADLLKINDLNLADLEVTDLLQDAPLLAALAAETASNGTLHSYVKETAAPVVGFRAANAGRDLSHSTDTAVTITLKILDASFQIDKALADAYMKGGPAGLVERELKRHLRAAFAAAELQIVNGVGADAGGFVGLTGASTIDALADGMVYNATGATALSSVYLIRTTPEGNDVTVITGNDGQINVGETVEQLVKDGDGKSYPAYTTSVLGWLGLQIGSAQSVGRIANIGAAAGKTLTDAMLGEALALFPSSRQPNLIVMNRRSRKQLQLSRTATSTTGAPAPRPDEYEGIPIITSEAVLNTETAVA
jgi:hypothetical protein